MDSGAWRATVRRVAESDMTEATLHTRTHFGLAPTFLPYLNLITSIKMLYANKVTFTGTKEQNFII